MKDRKEEEQKTEEKKKRQSGFDVTVDIAYECGNCCRLCPFPGLKCVVMAETRGIAETLS
jgi:hypothetical protein